MAFQRWRRGAIGRILRGQSQRPKARLRPTVDPRLRLMDLDQALGALLPATERAVFLAVLDSAMGRLRVEAGNARFAELLGRSPDALAGLLFPDPAGAPAGALLGAVALGEGGSFFVEDAACGAVVATLLPLGQGRFLATVERRARPGEVGSEAGSEAGAEAGSEHAHLAERRLAEAVASFSDGFALYDAEDRLVLANRQALDFAGAMAAAMVPGARHGDILRQGLALGVFAGTPEEAASFVEGRLRRHGRPPNLELVTLADGRSLRISETRTADGGTAMVFTDITEQKTIEAMLRKAADEAEKASQAKSEFLANMSHEFRTPLNAIIGFAEIIADDLLPGEAKHRYRDYARDIRTSGRHLLDVVNQVLDMSKIEAGRFDLHEEPLDVKEMAEDALRLIEPMAREAGVKLQGDFAPNLPRLSADRRGIRRILQNLLSNAIKFTPKGGRVDLKAALAEDGGMTLTVRDTGVGMAADDIPIALAPFGQVDSAATREKTGTGLGLPIVKATAELHGGTLVIESAPGKGTTVTVTMPARRVHLLRTASQRA